MKELRGLELSRRSEGPKGKNREVVGDIGKLDAEQKKRDIQDPLTYAIIGAAIKVHGALGPGFTEDTYHKALMVELAEQEIEFVCQPYYDVVYQGVRCGKYQPDLVAENRVVIELKAISDLAGDHFAQTISYLRASGLPVGLLINFGQKSLTWRRFCH